MGKVITCKDGRTIERVSRWVQVRHNYAPNKRNPLWYYVMDGCGYLEGQKEFDPESGLYLDYFRWNGRNWAIEQFFRETVPTMWEEDGKLHWIAGYDSENYYNPILIEFDECCENVRVYEEV